MNPVENGEPFEIYVKQVDDTPNPAEWITEIFIPVRLKSGSQGFRPTGILNQLATSEFKLS